MQTMENVSVLVLHLNSTVKLLEHAVSVTHPAKDVQKVM